MKDKALEYELIIGEDGCPLVDEFFIGNLVLDDLTGNIRKIIEIKSINDSKDKQGKIISYNAWKGNMIKINDSYLDGWRYEWEVNKVRRK